MARGRKVLLVALSEEPQGVEDSIAVDELELSRCTGRIDRDEAHQPHPIDELIRPLHSFSVQGHQKREQVLAPLMPFPVGQVATKRCHCPSWTNKPDQLTCTILVQIQLTEKIHLLESKNTPIISDHTWFISHDSLRHPCRET